MTDWSVDSLPREAREHWSKIATPARLAQYVTRDLSPDAQWRPAAHFDLINEAVTDACMDQQRQRFIDVEASVRHGKSLFLSGFLPVWYLGMFPDRQVFLLAYNEDKAAEWGEFTREVMAKYGPELFGVTVDPRSNSRTNWKIKGRRGEVVATGLRGTITGKGPSLTVIDDPIKSREEADSPAIRQRLLDGYYSNVRTRLPPWGTIVIAMARWREDDLVGEVVHGFSGENDAQAGTIDASLLEEGDEDYEVVVPEAPPVDTSGDEWEIIRLPAIAEAPDDADEDWTDAIGRSDGDPLWPEMWPKSALLNVKGELVKKGQLFVWDSLYQQNPSSKTGAMFKVDKWGRLPSPPPGLRLVRWWDLAATEDGGDWTVGMLVGMDSDNNTYVIDVQRKRLGEHAVKKLVRVVARSDGVGVPIRMEQERSGSGKSVVEAYRRELVGFDFDGIRPEEDKVSRARPVAGQQQVGNVYLIDGPWVADFIEEGRTFPRGRWDDQIDCLSGGFNFLAQLGPTTMETDHQRDTPLAALYGQAVREKSLPGASLVGSARGRFSR